MATTWTISNNSEVAADWETEQEGWSWDDSPNFMNWEDLDEYDWEDWT